MMNAVSRAQADTIPKAIKSEQQFLAYQGKGIRKIIIRKFGFEKMFADTSKKITYFGTNILNHLHRDSRDWVIEDNLFIKENTALDAYKLADNERFLRSLNFIQDARIEVDEIPGEPDSVDLEVITKDLFSISGQLNGVSNNNFKVQASENNFLGQGQRIEGAALFQTTRSPAFGYELMYNKTSIAHSFVNVALVYTTINNNLANGLPEETAWSIRLDRPLVSEFKHFAGGLLVGTNSSYNSYQQPDSLFYKYRYNTVDVWAGYALNANKYSFKHPVRDRQFLSLRYFQNNFAHIPYQIGNNFNFKFNDREAVLAQLTLFKQDFFKTNYIYGFGTTEDMPHGYNIAFTSGWYRQVNLSRIYAGAEINKYITTTQSDFFQYFLRTGAFLHKGQIEDVSVLVGGSVFSRLFFIGNVKLRQYVNTSYTRLFNNTAIDPLRIDNPFGLRYFSSDSTTGQQRISLHEETFMFLKYKLFGFKFAPFVFADAVLLTKQQDFSKGDAYYGVGCGVRTRNENLVFGTIEIRGVYFPRNVPYNNSFKILTTVDLQFRYNTTYVKAPDVVQLNTDPSNNVY